MPSNDDSPPPLLLVSDAAGFGAGTLLSLGFSTSRSVRLFPGKVTFHPSLHAETLSCFSWDFFP